MKKILGILFFSLLLSINVYADDQYSETNRKKSNIKLSCKIDNIFKVANQDGLHASKYDTSDLPKIIKNPDLPGIIIETNLNSRPVWINKIAAKSYPVQSVRKREQGTIVSIIILDKSGTVISIKVKEKSPKRLFKATVNIINKFKFPKPPDEVLDSQGLLKIKIPVNFILK